jgi:hypothetical protein
VPQGKKVVSVVPVMVGFQSNYSVVSTVAIDDAASVIYLKNKETVLCLSNDDLILRWRTDDQPTCTVIPDPALFQQLSSQWREERGATSSITRMAVCPSYQRIIGMGAKAIPLILRQLENEVDDPDHWFWALQSITGENPVSNDARGNMREMARAWLDWAYMSGYDW